jgi:hypothetical protein
MADATPRNFSESLRQSILKSIKDARIRYIAISNANHETNLNVKTFLLT